MKEVFGKLVYLSTFQSYVNARTRLPGEALQVFAAEISHLVDEAFPTYEANAKNREKFRRFVASIEPYLQLRIHEQGVDTLDAALTLALQIEQAHQASKLVNVGITGSTVILPCSYSDQRLKIKRRK
ncbi:Disks large [Labeo rohita]|uniref:Disks large n=1 Tax=Labeo rohita TaxID=84645 RepID=A0A498M727_LABRO|nr:Disks large [Labeo rohita]